VSCHAGSFERPDGAAGNRARLRSAPRAAAGVWSYAKTVCRAVMSESVAGICGVLTRFRNHYESWWDAMPDAGTSTNPDDLDDYSPATLRRPYSLYEDDEMAVDEDQPTRCTIIIDTDSADSEREKCDSDSPVAFLGSRKPLVRRRPPAPSAASRGRYDLLAACARGRAPQAANIIYGSAILKRYCFARDADRHGVRGGRSPPRDDPQHRRTRRRRDDNES
jgi:hypothetical protein